MQLVSKGIDKLNPSFVTMLGFFKPIIKITHMNLKLFKPLVALAVVVSLNFSTQNDAPKYSCT